MSWASPQRPPGLPGGGIPQSQRGVQGHPLGSSAAAPSRMRGTSDAWRECSPAAVGAPTVRERAAGIGGLQLAMCKSRLHLTTSSGEPTAKKNERSREARMGYRSMGRAEGSSSPTCIFSLVSMPSRLERRAALPPPGAAAQSAPATVGRAAGFAPRTGSQHRPAPCFPSPSPKSAPRILLPSDGCSRLSFQAGPQRGIGSGLGPPHASKHLMQPRRPSQGPMPDDRRRLKTGYLSKGPDPMRLELFRGAFREVLECWELAG